MSESSKVVFGVQLFDKIWSSILKKQESINRQLEESEKKLKLQMEENRRITEQSEEKFFRHMHDKNKQLEIIDQRIDKQLKENRFKSEEEEEEGVLDKKGRHSKKSKFKKLDSSGNIDRYSEYNKIFEAIVEAEITNEEKQELVETITKTYSKYSLSHPEGNLRATRSAEVPGDSAQIL